MTTAPLSRGRDFYPQFHSKVRLMNETGDNEVVRKQGLTERDTGGIHISGARTSAGSNCPGLKEEFVKESQEESRKKEDSWKHARRCLWWTLGTLYLLFACPECARPETLLGVPSDPSSRAMGGLLIIASIFVAVIVNAVVRRLARGHAIGEIGRHKRRKQRAAAAGR